MEVAHKNEDRKVGKELFFDSLPRDRNEEAFSGTVRDGLPSLQQRGPFLEPWLSSRHRARPHLASVEERRARGRVPGRDAAMPSCDEAGEGAADSASKSAREVAGVVARPPTRRTSFLRSLLCAGEEAMM